MAVGLRASANDPGTSPRSIGEGLGNVASGDDRAIMVAMAAAILFGAVHALGVRHQTRAACRLVFFCTGNIFDFHDDDDHVSFVSRTKLAKIGKPGSFAIGLQSVKCRLKPG